MRLGGGDTPRNALLGSWMLLAHSLLNFTFRFLWTSSDEQRRVNLNTTISVAPPTATSAGSQQNGSAKKSYKSVPESYKVLSETKYHKVVADLEAILLDISTDGVGINTPDGKISGSTLKDWAESLRNALETLSKAQ